MGPWRSTDSSIEIDAVMLAGRSRTVALVGEAKWGRSVDGARLARTLERKSEALPGNGQGVRLALCARDEVRKLPVGSITVTAADIFA